MSHDGGCGPDRQEAEPGNQSGARKVSVAVSPQHGTRQYGKQRNQSQPLKVEDPEVSSEKQRHKKESSDRSGANRRPADFTGHSVP